MAFNLSWVVPDRVGGMARPRPADLEWLREQGVTAVVTLTELPPAQIDGLESLHLPVVDMTSPSLDQLHRAIEFMREQVEAGGKVVAHCHAGLGRTGTLLAAYLVASERLSPADAIARIRGLRPGSIETAEQERTVRRYAELIGGGAS